MERVEEATQAERRRRPDAVMQTRVTELDEKKPSVRRPNAVILSVSEGSFTLNVVFTYVLGLRSFAALRMTRAVQDDKGGTG